MSDHSAHPPRPTRTGPAAPRLGADLRVCAGHAPVGPSGTCVAAPGARLPWLDASPARVTDPARRRGQAAAVLLALAAIVSGPAQGAPDAELSLQPAQVRALGVRAEAATSDAAAAGPLLPGRVVLPPALDRVLAAPLPALVESLSVAVGDRVQAGQVLARLRSAEAQGLAREGATAASQLALAQRQLARDEQLFQEGLIAASRLEATRAQAEQARLLLEERQRGSALAGAANAQGELLLRAPVAGTVTERLASVGQRLDMAAPVLRLAADGAPWLELQVPAADAAALRPGDRVELERPAGSATVLRVAPQVDALGQTVTVRAQLPAGTPLRVGQAVEARLALRREGRQRVPAAAVLHEGGRSVVFVETAAGRYRSVSVRVDAQGGGTALVQGLPARARVVVTGTAALKSLATGS